MANVTVTPEAFSLVFFDANEIKAAAEQAADDVGLPADAPIRVEVNESTPLGIVRITSLDPIVINADSGAFEDPKRPRRLSENYVKDVLSRSLYRITDRRSPGFADAPPDNKLSFAENVAWDTYAVGRAVRKGYLAQRPRRLYAFRNRHGFTDVADAAFERLWNAESLTWADIVALCAETEAAK